MASVTHDPLVGRTIDGRYQVTERVAAGGMAIVYRARDTTSGYDVALKVMHPHLAEGDQAADFLARFRREARAAAGLTHPGVVTVHGLGTDGTLNYLVMEYVDGTNLRDLVRSGKLTIRRTFSLLDQILSALGAAHDRDTVHRDIKPENVLLCTDEKTTKVADFGLARAVTEMTQTATGTVFGTVAYMAPEVISTGRCDVRADVYAVGVMAFEMLTGRQPFTGDTPIQVAYAHVNTSIPALSSVVGGLGDAAEHMVSTFAAREPNGRPDDGRAALRLLRATWKALPAEVLDSTPQQLGGPKPVRQRQLQLAGVVDAGGRHLATNIPVTLLPALGKADARRAIDPMKQHTPRRANPTGGLVTAGLLVLLLLVGLAWADQIGDFNSIPGTTDSPTGTTGTADPTSSG